jgi:hypothetical protein
MYTQRNPVEIQTATSLTLISVIAQQYSSATILSLRFHSRKDNFDTRLKQFC